MMQYSSIFRQLVSTHSSRCLSLTRCRTFSSSAAYDHLFDAIKTASSTKLEKFKLLKSQYGETEIGNIKVNQVIGGMRGMVSMLTETSNLDPEGGIRFSGYSIDECLEALPTAVPNGSPLPEGLLWLLLTGELPKPTDVQAISELLNEKSSIPDYVFSTLDALPKDTHPMTQLVVGAAALQNESIFANNYHKGMHKSEYWSSTLQDGIALISKLPALAAYIFQSTYKNGTLPKLEGSHDWASKYAKLLGFDSVEHAELMRLYLFLHADHEGGNVSSHANTLVGSALSDPYLSYAAAMTGLAGPLHGLANQESLKWIKQLHASLNGQTPTVELIRRIASDTLKSGQVIPGFGHAVLRVTDPRFTAQNKFSKKNLPDSELFKLLEICVEAIPSVLIESGKVKNPYPNVDLHSGIVLQHYGLVEEGYYTVLFGVSRSIGLVAQSVWNRIFGLPIERPKSLTLDALLQKCK